MAYITVKNLSCGYSGRPVAEKISFTLEKGSYLTVLGENGAGKSTFIKTLLGLIPALGGEITLGEGLGRHEIGYLPQQTDLQRDFPASVQEIVRSGLVGRRGLRPFLRHEEKEEIRRIMTRLGIDGMARKSYRELSGGQQQRVLLARACLAAGKVILLDEPVTGLDPKASAEFYRLIRELNKEGMAVLMVSHDVAAAEADATHILHVGKKVFFGTKDEYEKSAIGRHFLASSREDDADGEKHDNYKEIHYREGFDGTGELRQEDSARDGSLAGSSGLSPAGSVRERSSRKKSKQVPYDASWKKKPAAGQSKPDTSHPQPAAGQPQTDTKETKSINNKEGE